MYAYQQLATETYNDALAVSAAHEILPALERKFVILEAMQEKHERFGRPHARSLHRAYADFGSALRLMLGRGRFQLDECGAWITNPQRESGEADVLAAPEQAALIASAMSLNKLISDLQLDAEDWIALNREAFNTVRSTVGLPPMSDEGFRTTYFGSIAGDVVRFFS